MVKATLVLEGGANRGVFTSGVLDYLMEKDMYMSNVIGVSAGACADGGIAAGNGAGAFCDYGWG